mmetsp:Transcript_27851/g.67141  ORF Transcript_27851/g.67141 Transcript_27851/m.67141 type:complete len:91 (-) Transcript_27851:706-978(-)
MSVAESSHRPTTAASFFEVKDRPSKNKRTLLLSPSTIRSSRSHFFCVNRLNPTLKARCHLNRSVFKDSIRQFVDTHLQLNNRQRPFIVEP